MEFWNKVKLELKNKLSTPAYNTFISSARMDSLEDGVLSLLVPSEFFRMWVKERCEKVLQEVLHAELQQPIMINYVVKANFDPLPESEEKPLEIKTPSLGINTISAPGGFIKGNYNPRYRLDNYVVGNNNRFAHAAAVAVAEKPATAYNPLFVCGGSGLGKTHLMHALAQRALAVNPALKIMYVKSEEFVNEMIDSIQEGRVERMNQFRNKFRTVDMLLIDDIQFLMGKERSQEEFFHAFNTLYETKKQIVVNSDRPPRELHSLEDRLKSRFSWGLICDIQPPDFETRIAILRKKIENDPVKVPEEVLQYIAKQIPSNVRDLEGALTRIVAHASLIGQQEISIDFAAETLKNLFTVQQEKHVTISTIKQVVAEYFKIDIEELSAKVRTKDIAEARQIAMFLAKEMTPSALVKIGANFGGRDHTTVIHACDKIKEAMKNDPVMLDTITKLKKEILSRNN
jgi:chromosomal replication initiator protein